MDANNVKCFLAKLNMFVASPTAQTFQELQYDDVLAYLGSIGHVMALQQTQTTAARVAAAGFSSDEERWFKAVQQLYNAVKFDDMAMALLYAVQLQTALSVETDRTPNNAVHPVHATVIDMVGDILKEAKDE